MGVDALKSALPDYAKDIKLNLGSVIGHLDAHRAAALGHRPGLRHRHARRRRCSRELAPEAADYLSAEAYTAAKAAAAIMAMNNVFYRATPPAGGREYATLRARLRMNVIGNPGVDKVDFELWSLAVSAINGCGSASTRTSRCCARPACRASRSRRRCGSPR